MSPAASSYQNICSRRNIQFTFRSIIPYRKGTKRQSDCPMAGPLSKLIYHLPIHSGDRFFHHSGPPRRARSKHGSLASKRASLYRKTSLCPAGLRRISLNARRPRSAFGGAEGMLFHCVWVRFAYVSLFG